MSQTSVCFDTETTGLNPLTAELVGIAFSWEAHKGFYIPFQEAFEVLSNHIRNVGEVTDKLMKLQKAKKELTKEEGNKRVTNNNVFVGSTTDLQRMLLNKDDNIIDVEPDKE